MPLTIHLTQLDDGPRNLQGKLSPQELELDTQDELIRPDSDLDYSFSVERQENHLLCRGELQMTFEFECARCLEAFKKKTELRHWSQLIPLQGEDALHVNNDSLNLTPILREDMLLSLPQHPLCAEGCDGINRSPRKAAGPPDVLSGPDEPSSAWTALDQLRLE